MTQGIVLPERLAAVELLSLRQVPSPGILFSGQALVVTMFPSGGLLYVFPSVLCLHMVLQNKPYNMIQISMRLPVLSHR